VATSAGFENKVGFLWKIADKLRGDFKPHEYGAIMLPQSGERGQIGPAKVPSTMSRSS